MALAPSLSDVAANAAADAVCALLDDGFLRIYAGSKPATADTPLDSNDLLAELRFSATAFGSAVAGVAVANAITAEPSAPDTGTASFFRTFQADGVTAVFDGSVGTNTADLLLSTVSIASGVAVSVSAFEYRQRKIG